MRTKEGDPLDTAKLEEDIARIYGLDLFETVTYSLEQADDGVAISIVAKEHPAGKDSLRFGLELLTDLDREADYNVGVSYTVPALNELNGEWRSQALIGSRLGLASELYQPFDPAARFFVNPGISIFDRDVDIFEDREKIAEARVIDARVRLLLGSNLSDDLGVFAEISRGFGRIREVTGTGAVADEGFDTAAVGVGIFFDDLDNLSFPREGATVTGRYDWSPESLGADEEFHALQLRGRVAKTWGIHTLVLGQIANLTVDGNRGAADLFQLGGPFQLSGLLRGALTGDNALLTSAVYYNKLEEYGPAFLDTPIYLGGSIEYGNIFEDIEDIEIGEMLVSGSLFLGVDTYVGPAYLGYGYTEGGDHALFLLVGGVF
jgi:NTE family protein